MRFETGVLIGRGGAGEVYKAFDPQLRRFVALKYLRHDDPEMAHRMLREARAQASIDHELICKVYETGEAGGRPYIAMQFIDGEPLEKAARSMGLDQKVKIVADVAGAIAAAHKIGLIHRDLKPGNIIVEKCDDGSWKPHVLDFGLVGGTEGSALTRTGEVLGTPAFMSPEQAKGENRKMDRRTDVYGLGALLYFLLTGRPPFPAESSVETLLHVVRDDPAPPRKLDPGIPADLETIALKCLEKEPGRRYDSALALEQDLHRYLAGEAIFARPQSWRYRVARRIRKHPYSYATATALSAAFVAAAGLWLHSQWTAARQERLSRQFGQEVERIKGMMDRAYLLPLHDISPEKTRARGELEMISRQARQLGRDAAGPGALALGEGYYSLRDFGSARRYLQEAWDRGQRDPETELALGRCLGVLYQRGLDAVARLNDKNLRQAQTQLIRRQLRDPALRYLKEARPASHQKTDPLGNGFIALYENRHAEALKDANSSIANDPLSYEALELKGDALTALARSLAEKGDYQGATGEFELARGAYEAAAGIARSNPSLYERESDLLLGEAEMAAEHGLPPATQYDASLDANRRAREADPSDPRLYDQEATIYISNAEYLANASQNHHDSLGRSMTAARQALRLDANDVTALKVVVLLDVASSYYGSAKPDAGKFARLNSEVASLKHAIGLRPEPGNLDGLADILTMQASLLEREGRDALQIYSDAVAAYRNAAALGISSRYLAAGTANGCVMKAAYEIAHGLDPSGDLRVAAESARMVIAADPSSANAYVKLSESDYFRALYQAEEEKDPRAALEAALASSEKALTFDRHNMDACFDQVQELTELMRFEVTHGQNIAPLLAAAAADLAEYRKVDASGYWQPYWKGETELMEGREDLVSGHSPGGAFEHALNDFQRAASINPRSRTWEGVENLYRWRAEWKSTMGQPYGQDITAGLNAASLAFDDDPRMAQALAEEGVLYLLRAQAEKNTAARVASAAQAEKAFSSAFASNPLLKPQYERWSREAERLSAPASGQTPPRGAPPIPAAVSPRQTSKERSRLRHEWVTPTGVERGGRRGAACPSA